MYAMKSMLAIRIYSRQSKAKQKNLRSTPTSDFEVVQLDVNPLRMVHIRSNLPIAVREWLVNFLRTKVELFVVSPHEMIGYIP